MRTSRTPISVSKSNAGSTPARNRLSSNDEDGRGYPGKARNARPVLSARKDQPNRKRIEAESYISGGDAMISFAVTHHTINRLGALIRT